MIISQRVDAHSSSGLNDDAINTIGRTLARYPEVERAILFGSRAKGTHQVGSDIDLALVGSIPSSQLAHIHAELEELPLPVFFSVVDYDEIDAPIRAHIDRVGKVLFQRGQAI